MTKNDLLKIKCFLLDMDGTIYLGNSPIGDMKNTLEKIRQSGRKIIYLTNNSSKGIEKYEEKLQKIGLFGKGDEVYSTGVACKEYLLKKYKDKKIYLLGTDNLKKEYIQAGLNIVDKAPCDVAVMAYDTELTFEKIVEFNKCLVTGAYYIATHPDYVCPTEDISMPDVGSFIKMFETSCGRLPDEIIGKPNTGMGERIMEKYDLKQEEIIMVGDRLYTDIAFGNNCNFNSLLVMSGETTKEILNESTVKPKYVLDSLNDIVEYL